MESERDANASKDTAAMDTPAEAMKDSESQFEETARETAEEGARPMGSGTRTPSSPPES